MIVIEQFRIADVVDHAHVASWKKQIKPVSKEGVPVEVIQFIETLDASLGDFAQYGKEVAKISGKDLHLCGIKEWEGEQVFSFATYSVSIPKMQVVDNTACMLRSFHKRGKQGLIDYCRARVRGTELQGLLTILNVEVFKEKREEFDRMMEEINSSKI